MLHPLPHPMAHPLPLPRPLRPHPLPHPLPRPLPRPLITMMQLSVMLLVDWQKRAAEHGAKALAICTVTDHIRTGEALSSEERQLSLDEMIELALKSTQI